MVSWCPLFSLWKLPGRRGAADEDEHARRGDGIIAAMGCWISTHNPHTLNSVPYHIYFKKHRKILPSEGECVFFYETDSPEKGFDKRGRKAIIYLAKASGKLEKNHHANRDKWPLKMDCHDHQVLSIPLDDAKKLVEQPFYRRTLARISHGECQKLQAAGKKNSD